MSDVSSLTELARFVGSSGLDMESANARGIAVNGSVLPRGKRQGRQRVSELLSVVLTLSARTRRMVMPKVEIELDVFTPAGGRAVLIKLPG
ncbi:MAG TPA: hypothetical protein VG757_03015 [Devosia sp.]|nr:hypothetical protein [Devosia sp.]